MYQKRDFSSGTNQKLNSRFLPRSLPWQIVGLWLTTFDALKNLPRTKAVRVLGKRKGDTINHIERTDGWNARQKTYRHISTDLAPRCSDRMITACTRNKFSAVFDMMPHSSVENATLFRQPFFYIGDSDLASGQTRDKSKQRKNVPQKNARNKRNRASILSFLFGDFFNCCVGQTQTRL